VSSGEASNQHGWLKWGRRLLNLVFFILVPIFLYLLIKNTHWNEVKNALHQLEWSTLGLCLVIAVLSYCVYGSYDLLGRLYSGHKLPIHQVLSVAAVCYAFTLNLSYWVGGFALRFRLYSRLGLDNATITKIFSLSVITNWLGYMLMAGVIFTLKLPDLPPNWKIGETGLQLVGITLLLVAGIYIGACLFSRRRSWQIRDHKIVLPKFHIVVMQACLAMINWSLMALLVFVLLPEKVTYMTVLGVLLISSMAGVITHIPAGLGVLEAVFVAMLQHQFSTGVILAAIIGYRLVYFLIPLGVAGIVYFLLEGQANMNGDKKAVAYDGLASK
jgi:uncharacterized membrane protein YbhN (UPF0104 family)